MKAFHSKKGKTNAEVRCRPTFKLMSWSFKTLHFILGFLLPSFYKYISELLERKNYEVLLFRNDYESLYHCCCCIDSVVSDSVRPHRRQPTRLPRPWDSPGKNAGVGCHFLLQCMKVKSESEVAQSCPTPSDPMDCSLLGYCVHGVFQARVLEWVAIAFRGIPFNLQLYFPIPLGLSWHALFWDLGQELQTQVTAEAR